MNSDQETHGRELKHSADTETAELSVSSGLVRDRSDGGGHGGTSPLTPAPPVSSIERLFEKLWLFEILALVISTLALIGLVILLRVTEGHRVPNWTIRPRGTRPLTLTINSVISIFSTAVKSTVLIPVAAAMGELKWIWFQQAGHRLTDIQLFDSAARGPLGSAIMLWRLRGRSLACLGALIVIGSLTLDFAFQQLVTYPLKPVRIVAASIPRTNNYAAVSPGPIQALRSPDPAMIGAVYAGMFARGDTFPIPSDCQTGNCTWTEDYTSLALCSRCYDTTDQIQKQCSTIDYIGFDDNGNQIVLGDPIPYCNRTLPSGQLIPGYTLGDQVLVDINGAPASPDTYFGNGLYAHLAVLSVMRAGWDHVLENTTHTENITYTRAYNLIRSSNATECGIDVCVKKYKANTVNSRFTETVVDTFFNTTDHSNGTPSPTSLLIQPPPSWSNQSDANANNQFLIDPFAITALRSLFPSTLWSGRFNDSGSRETSRDNDFLAVVRYLDEPGTADLMASLAASMTRQMRTNPGDGTNQQGPGREAVGVSTQLFPHVNVRWGWIAAPATLIALSAALLLATVVHSKHQGANMLWKANALANFYHPLTKEGRERLRDAHSAKHAEKIAAEMTVKWEETDSGGRFVPVPAPAPVPVGEFQGEGEGESQRRS